ncbi:MAG: gluconeogenesis factor YvcK family protein [Acidimicrobiales bacterium]
MKLVAVGGGHGTAVSLRALKRLSGDVTGVVSVADDGGSTGRLRAMLDVAAVGDLRKCLVALADPENPLTRSFEHRFRVGELSGHAVGNLLLVGLIDATGNLEESVHAVAQVMGVTGTIVPASCEGVVLVATTEEGARRGQTKVAKSSTIRRLSLEPANPAAPIAAVEAIERADVVVIGPGSLFTSVIAACVVPGITQALAGTTAMKIYVANLRAESPETDGFSLSDHLDALERHGVRVDLVLVDQRSPFAHDEVRVATKVVDLAGKNGLVHDVQKLTMAVLESAKIDNRQNEGDTSGNTGRD